MKVTAINGSPHENGNTYHALKTVTEVLQEEGIETEIVRVGHLPLNGCVGCGGCAKGSCVFADNAFTEAVNKLYDCDGVLLGSPVYYAGMAGTLKSFLDRAFYMSNGRMRHKVGAAVAVCRRSGGMTTFEQLNNYFLISEMIVAPSYYWNVGHGRTEGELLQDGEAMCTLRNLGRNMAWILKMKEATAQTLTPPQQEPRVRTNFIR